MFQKLIQVKNIDGKITQEKNWSITCSARWVSLNPEEEMCSLASLETGIQKHEAQKLPEIVIIPFIYPEPQDLSFLFSLHTGSILFCLNLYCSVQEFLATYGYLLKFKLI